MRNSKYESSKIRISGQSNSLIVTTALKINKTASVGYREGKGSGNWKGWGEGEAKTGNLWVLFFLYLSANTYPQLGMAWKKCKCCVKKLRREGVCFVHLWKYW